MEKTLILYSLIVFGASFLQATLGFGFPIIAMALLPMLFGYQSAVMLVQCVATISTLYLSIKHFKKINWKVLLPILIPSVVIGCLVTLFSFSLSSDILSIMLGLMLTFLSVYFLFFNRKVHFKPTIASGIVMGIGGGVGNGLFSVGGPAVAVYLLTSLEDKVEYFASMQTFFTVCNIANLIVRISKGALESVDFKTIAIGWVLMLAGTFAGQKCFSLFKGETLKKIVYSFIGINGIWIIVSHLV